MIETSKTFALPTKPTRLRDYAEINKARITTLIVVIAWCGYFFAAHKSGQPALAAALLHALLGVGLVSSGTAALNEVLESNVDARMRRTAQRPIPVGRMARAHAAAVGLLLTLGGSVYLAVVANPLTGLLAFLTALVYLAAYTPLKRVSRGLHTRGCISGSDASGSRIDRRPRKGGNRDPDSFRNHVCLAVCTRW